MQPGLLENILDNLDRGVIATNTSRQIIYCNRRFRDLFEVTDEFIDKHRDLDDLSRELTRMYGVDPLTAAKGQNMDAASEQDIIELAKPSGAVLEGRRTSLADGVQIFIFAEETEDSDTEVQLVDIDSHLLTQEYVKANKRLRREIETRKRIEAELVRSEERYRSMFYSNNAVKLLIDAETGSIEEANDEACSFYGYSKEELLKLNVCDIDILTPNNLHKILETARTSEKWHFFFKHRMKNGQIREVEFHSSPVVHNGRILLFAIIQDVTQRIQAEIGLKESELRYRTLFNNACDAIVVHDMRGLILDVNKLACDRFKMGHDELIGRNLASFYLPEFSKKGSKIRRALREHGSVYFETDQRLPDGRILPIEVDAKVIPYQGRLAVISVSRDLSERKRNEAMLRKLTTRLISVQEEERKRIGRELHDQLCQNLTAVKVLLEGQIRRAPDTFDELLSENLKRTIIVLQDSVAEVRRIIMNLRPTVLDDMGISAAVNWLCNETEKLHPSLSVKAYLSLQDEDCSEEMKTVLFRTTQECLNNAVKHSKGDKVEIELTRLDHEIRLAVRDNGVGFSQEETSNKGVGLHGMRERLEPLGGNIRINSTPGQGTTVMVYVPLGPKGSSMPEREAAFDLSNNFRI